MKRLENKTMDKNINEIICQIVNKEDQTPYIVKNVEDGLKKQLFTLDKMTTAICIILLIVLLIYTREGD